MLTKTQVSAFDTSSNMAKFLLTDNIYWDDSKKPQEQSAAAKAWLDQTRRTNANKIVKDDYGRPVQYIYETDRATLVVEHVYIEKHSTDWSLDKIEFHVTKK